MLTCAMNQSLVRNLGEDRLTGPTLSDCCGACRAPYVYGARALPKVPPSEMQRFLMPRRSRTLRHAQRWCTSSASFEVAEKEEEAADSPSRARPVRRNLLELSKRELQEAVEELGMKRFRAKQVRTMHRHPTCGAHVPRTVRTLSEMCRHVHTLACRGRCRGRWHARLHQSGLS